MWYTAQSLDHIYFMDANYGGKTIETQTKMLCLQNRALKKSSLGHLMRQLKISKNSGKHSSLGTWSLCKVAYLCTSWNRKSS